MINHKVSIIVPIYNSEKYLSRCIESILNQTYTNIEIILINDGSNDQSGEICDGYAKNDNRIIVVHKKKSGVSDSRNEGIKLCSGEYIHFVDSDDYIDENMTELLYAAMQHNKSDLVICGHKIIDNTTGICKLKSYLHDEIICGFEKFMNIFDILYLNGHLHSPCNKMYKKRIINEFNIVFDSKIDLGEDLIFNLELIKKCNSFFIISSCPYNNILYNDSNTLSTKYRVNMYEIQKLLFEHVIALYTNVLDYSQQIKDLENEYTRALISNIVLYDANYGGVTDYNTHIEKMKKIRGDKVLIKSINNLEFKLIQEKLIKFFLQRNIYIAIFIYTKAKLLIKKRLPSAFRLLKRVGGVSTYE